MSPAVIKLPFNRAKPPGLTWKKSYGLSSQGYLALNPDGSLAKNQVIFDFESAKKSGSTVVSRTWYERKHNVRIIDTKGGAR